MYGPPKSHAQNGHLLAYGFLRTTIGLVAAAGLQQIYDPIPRSIFCDVSVGQQNMPILKKKQNSTFCMTGCL